MADNLTADNIRRLNVYDRLEVISRFAAVEQDGTLTCRDCGTISVMEQLVRPKAPAKFPEMEHDVNCVFSKVRRALKLSETMATL